MMRREWCVQSRQRHALASTWLFYIMILVFFPLAFPADEHLLHAVFPGIIWISLLFALFLASERLFQDEEQDGVLEQWLLDPERVLTRLYAKLTVHWLVNILPMLLFVPGVVILFNLPLASALSLALAIVAGTPSLFLFCALAAALSSGVRQQSMFMALIILPLTLPILILGSGVLTASLHSMPISGLLALLTALSLFAGLILPKVIALVIRLQVS